MFAPFYALCEKFKLVEGYSKLSGHKQMIKKIKFPFVLDVSSWKGAINWHDVHPRPDLVICLASNGLQEWDYLFPIHWNNLKHLQIKKGAYHVFDPKINSRQQVSSYMGAVEKAGWFDENCIPPILDASAFQCNFNRTPIQKRLRQCLEEMKRYTGQVPIIQISRRYWKFLRDWRGNYPDWANDYLLWLPWYPSDPNIYKCPPTNTFPNGWEDWAIWKYDEMATISGIKGYVALSTLSETYASQLGINCDNVTITRLEQMNFKLEATVVSPEGIIIRRHSVMNSKMLAFLSQGSKLVGESVEFVNLYEAWLQVTKPVIGWCPIVHTGRTYLSIVDRK